MMELTGSARRVAWRLGRKLYRAARGEGTNRIDINGEAYVQRQVIAAAVPDDNLTVFDVGASLGEWTQSLLGQIKPSGSAAADIWAFEPTPESFERIRVRFADIENVRCVCLALSNAPGCDRLMMASPTGGTNTLSFDNVLTSQAHAVTEVRKSTVAEFCEQNGINHIHLLKCDTEGHDLRVIEGAKPLLAAERIDVFQFEYNHRWIYERAFLKDVFDIMGDLPYTVAAMQSSRIDLLRAWHPELDRFFEANYLLVHERALGWFNVLDGRFDISNTYA